MEETKKVETRALVPQPTDSSTKSEKEPSASKAAAEDVAADAVAADDTTAPEAIEAEDGDIWPMYGRVLATLFTLLVYLYFVALVCSIYQRNQKLDDIDAMAQDVKCMIANLHAIDQELYNKIQLLQDEDALATATANPMANATDISTAMSTALSTELETAMTYTTY